MRLKNNIYNSRRQVRFNPSDLFLYAVTDSGMNRKWGHSISDAVKASVEGGATIVQLRFASADTVFPQWWITMLHFALYENILRVIGELLLPFFCISASNASNPSDVHMLMFSSCPPFAFALSQLIVTLCMVMFFP